MSSLDLSDPLAVARLAQGQARPALEDLLAAFGRFLVLDDHDHLLFSLGVAVAAHFEGDPLWGLLVGAPSSSKTEILRALDDAADEHLDEISAAGLLSWLPGKRPRPTGLLARRQGRVFATVLDLSTLLAMSDRGSRDQLYALLRRAYDGRVVRELGNAPAPLRWEGRLTLLAAVTPSIDSFSSHADALGPRWLLLRLTAADERVRRAASRSARRNGSALGEHRTHVRGLATKIIANAAARAPEVVLSDELGDQLDSAAMVTCLGRASVERSGYGRREILGLAVVEEPPRLAAQLDQLARALRALGLSEDAAVALCRRAALDSMPPPRRAALNALAPGEALTSAELARRAGADRSVMRMALEELAAIGVATYVGAALDDGDEPSRTPKPWHLAGTWTSLIQHVFAPAGGVS